LRSLVRKEPTLGPPIRGIAGKGKYTGIKIKSKRGTEESKSKQESWGGGGRRTGNQIGKGGKLAIPHTKKFNPGEQGTKLSRNFPKQKTKQHNPPGGQPVRP